LVVDDDELIRQFVVDALGQEGYRTLAAANGAEALGLLARADPDLALLDMWMPVMDGWAFAREVKERGIRLTVVTMTAAENARRFAAEIGAAAYLGKPFDLDDLLGVVARCCRVARQRHTSAGPGGAP
jgi:DNA-binding response OmpR family regulator